MRKPKRALKKPPAFKTEDEARVIRFPNLRPSTTAISVRLPDTLLTELKLLANERDVPYQSLLKVYLAERVKAERERTRRAQRPGKRLQK
jgi:predicted DNA binding CopG/RHH family protein